MFLKSAFRQFSCQSLPELDVFCYSHEEWPNCSLLWKFGLNISQDGVLVTVSFRTLFRASTTLKWAILSPWQREWCHSIWFFISFQKMLVLLTFNKGNMVFHFEWGFPVKNLKHMNHLKTLTMVSMETKVVSRDSFLDKLSEKVYLNGFWEG